MKPSKGEQARAHYRDRHICLGDLPEQSTAHDFKVRFNKTSDEDLRRQSGLQPAVTVFSVAGGSIQEQNHDEFALVYGNTQPKKRGRRPKATTSPTAPPATKSLPLQVETGAPVAANRRNRAAAPALYPGAQYGPVSPAYNSDNTPVSATNPHQLQVEASYQVPYPMTPNYEIRQHFANGGVQSMGFMDPASYNNLATFAPPYQVSPVGEYQSGLMPTSYLSQDPSAFEGSNAPYGNSYFPQAESEYSRSEPFTDYPQTQFDQFSGHVVHDATYPGAGGVNYSDGNEYQFYPPNAGQ